MALTACCTAALQRIEACLLDGDTDAIAQYEQFGMMLNWVSMLSTFGNEFGMIEGELASTLVLI